MSQTYAMPEASCPSRGDQPAGHQRIRAKDIARETSRGVKLNDTFNDAAKEKNTVRSSIKGRGPRSGSIDGSHLLNFRMKPPSSEALSLPPRQHSHRFRTSTQKNFNAEMAERRARRALSSAFFLHSSPCHAFILDPSFTEGTESAAGDGKHRYSGPDVTIPWTAVRMVKWLVNATSDGCGVTTSTNEAITCPICLDVYTAPRVGKCGHTFCWPCILRHLYSCAQLTKTCALLETKCPCCSEFINLDDLKPLVFHSVSAPRKEDIFSFQRLYRRKNGFIPFPACSNRQELRVDSTVGKRFPVCTHKYSEFCRYSVMDDRTDVYITHLQSDIREINIFRNQVSTSGLMDDSTLNFIILAEDSVKLKLEIAKAESSCGRTSESTESRSIRYPDGAASIQGSNSGERITSDNSTQFYQASDGQLCFLSGFNMQCIVTEFQERRTETSVDNDELACAPEKGQDFGKGNKSQPKLKDMLTTLPEYIEGPVIDVETIHLTAEVRKRYAFLSHLPLYTDVKLVEINLGRLLSDGTRKQFKGEMDRRREKRRSKIQKDNKADKLAAIHCQREEAERRQRQLDMADDDFFRPLSLSNSLESPLCEEFGPNLITDDTMSRTREFREMEESSKSAPVVTMLEPAYSFKTVCQTNGVWPDLNESTRTLSSEKVNRAALGSSGTAPCSAWNGPGSDEPLTKLFKNTNPSSPSCVHEVGSGRKAKSKGKKILLFSTGGHRGSS